MTGTPSTTSAEAEKGPNPEAADEVTREMKAQCGESVHQPAQETPVAEAPSDIDERELRLPIYAVDAVVRRALSLQKTQLGSVESDTDSADAA